MTPHPFKETYMRVAEKFIPALLNGTKQITIRNGNRDYAEKISIVGYPAIVESVKHCTLATCPLEILKDDGFIDVEDAVKKMKEYYSDITKDTEITVVRFHLV